MTSIVINGFVDKPVLRDFIWYCCDYLKVYPISIDLGVLESENVRGICIDNSREDFTILVKPNDHKLRTIAHEMVHVKQYMKQNLGDLLDRTYDYINCWWEVEARLLSKLIVQEYHELKKETEIAA